MLCCEVSYGVEVELTVIVFSRGTGVGKVDIIMSDDLFSVTRLFTLSWSIAVGGVALELAHLCLWGLLS